MSHCVITGGGGFIGSNLADFYLSRGSDVTVLDNFSRPGSDQNRAWLESRYGSRLKVVCADIRQPGGSGYEAIAGADVVFHLAAQVAVTTSVSDPLLDFQENAFGTLNVLEAARRAPKPPVLVYSSTNKVYGRMADLCIVERNGRYAYKDSDRGISEDRPLDPYSPYGCSKCAGDQYFLDYARIYGLKTIVFRQSCIYGPRQFGMEDQGWLAWLALRAWQQKPFTIYGDGKQVRDALYVTDLLEAYDAAVRQIATTSGRAYNIGGGPENTLSLLELIVMLEQHFGRRPQYSFGDWRPGDQPVFVSNIDRAKADFGWSPRTSVPEGVGKLIGWIKNNEGLFDSIQAAQRAVGAGAG